MPEVYNKFETRIAFAQASAAGQDPYTAWNTASGAQANTAIWGYIRTLDFTSAFTLNAVMRGLGDNRVGHFKNAGVTPIQINMELDFTGQIPIYSAYNASIPMVMAEIMYKQSGGASAFTLLLGVAIPSMQWTVNEQANSLRLTMQALAMLNTASGYIMT